MLCMREISVGEMVSVEGGIWAEELAALAAECLLFEAVNTACNNAIHSIAEGMNKLR